MYRIVMPAYNAGKRIFGTLEENLQHAEKTIVVDDCSTDNTFSEVARFNQTHDAGVKLYRMKQNGRKVGAIKLGAEAAKRKNIKYVVLLDDDTELASPPWKIEGACEKMEENGYGAASFRRVPKTPDTLIGRLQSMEYTAINAMGSFLKNTDRQRCLHGSGGIYDVESLLKALNMHSGDHDGDDHETTYILQGNGCSSTCFDDIIVRPSVPETFSERVQQSRRWERGAIKTNIRRKEYLTGNIADLNRLSLVQLAEAVNYICFGAAQAAFEVAANAHSMIDGENRENAVLLPVLPIYLLALNIASKNLAYYDVIREMAKNEISLASSQPKPANEISN